MPYAEVAEGDVSILDDIQSKAIVPGDGTLAAKTCGTYERD
jgi:hypothetical protein